MNRLALTFTLLSFSITPALAQQTAVPVATAVAPQSAPPGGVPAPPPDTALAIPAPPGARLRVEMDARDADILGVFKSLLQGLSEGTVGAVKALKPADAAKLNDEMSSANLADILKNVTHIHFELLELSGSTASLPYVPGKRSLTVSYAIRTLSTTKIAPAAPDNEVPFYETAFNNEGGHRILFTDFDEFHVLMTGFDEPHGYALVVDLPGMVAVLRSDGYPDLEKLSALGPIIADAFKTGMSMPGMKSMIPNTLAPKPLVK